MIVSLEQYEELKQEMLRQAAPSLWKLLNCTFTMLTVSPQRLERMQFRARQELRQITKFESPKRGYLE